MNIYQPAEVQESEEEEEERKEGEEELQQRTQGRTMEGLQNLR